MHILRYILDTWTGYHAYSELELEISKACSLKQGLSFFPSGSDRFPRSARRNRWARRGRPIEIKARSDEHRETDWRGVDGRTCAVRTHAPRCAFPLPQPFSSFHSRMRAPRVFRPSWPHAGSVPAGVTVIPCQSRCPWEISEHPCAASLPLVSLQTVTAFKTSEPHPEADV